MFAKTSAFSDPLISRALSLQLGLFQNVLEKHSMKLIKIKRSFDKNKEAGSNYMAESLPSMY